MFKVLRPYALMLVICLMLFVVVIYCYHGDGSDGGMCVQSITAIRTTITNL